MLFLAFLLLVVAAGCVSTPADKDAPIDQAALAVGQKTITGIETVATEGADTVIIKSTGGLSYTSVKQHDPLGVILVFPETSLGELASEYTPDSRTIRRITPSLSPDQKNVRLEIGLALDLPYEVIKNGDDLEIVFTHEEEITDAGDAVATPATMGTASEKAATSWSPAATQRFSSKGSGKSSTIEKIDFSSQEDGKSMVILGTTDPVAYDVQKISDRKLKVRLHNTRLPDFRKDRPLIATRFESAIDRIDPVQARDAANTTDIIISLRELVPYRPVQTGNVLTLYFDASSVGPRPMAVSKAPDWQNALNENSTAADSSYPETLSQMPPKKQNQAVPGSRYAELMKENKQYTGQRIALDFYQTDIKNVFKILQQVSGKNYAVDKDVTGEVTISLEKPVPWDQVLDLILQMNKLGKEEKTDIIRIATLETLKKEEEDRAAQMKAEMERIEKSQQLIPIETVYLPISYADAEKDVYPLIKDYSESKTKNKEERGDFLGLGKVSERTKAVLDKRNNQLIVTSSKEGIAKFTEFLSKIDKVTPQVLIEARIVEISDTFDRDLGVEWGAQGENIYKNNLAGQYSYNMAMNLPGTEFYTDQIENGMSGGAIGLSFERLDAWGTPIVLDATLRAMEQEGNGKIISAPKILTMDNQEAKIIQGQRVPYQTVEDGTVDVQFQDINLELAVTPHVTPDNRISMKIKTTKNEIIEFVPPFGYPRSSTNEAETVLLVDNGETIVIGGVVKNDIKKTETGFPVLKDIPIVGWLFKKESTVEAKQELMIFLTPKIVQLEQRDLVKIEN
jgi:type IV pilus assembly protein PilQ